MAAASYVNGSATALEPYQPIPGMSTRENHARAVDHIEKVQSHLKDILRKHSATEKAVAIKDQALGKVMSSAQALGLQGAQTGVALVMGSAIGFADGRWGGEQGHFAKAGVPLDGAIAILGHAAGLATFLLADTPNVTRFLHAVGDAGTAAVFHRWAKDLGVTSAHKAGLATAPSAANGVRGGTLYPAPPPPPHK